MEYKRRDLSIYIHIPFCKAKCSYCDFLSFGGCSIGEQREYIEALCKEIEAFGLIAEEYRVVTIFIGGGTPSFIPAEYIGRVLHKVRDTFNVDKNAEITIEGNPDSLTADKLKLYRNCGINRLSIGLQSTNDELLRALGRVHNYDQFIAAYSRAREAGFDNINIDIMSRLPGESMESYVKTLARVVELQPEHISAYSLIVEEGTPLAENEELLTKLPSEDMDRKQYARTKLLLGQSGYERYEISNYAKRGYECRHNMVYWTGGEYLGVGLNAASYLKLQDKFMDEDDCKAYELGYEDIVENISGYDSDREDSRGKDSIGKIDIPDKEEGKLTPVRFKGVDSIAEYIGRFSRFGSGWTELSRLTELIGNYYTDIQVLNAKDEMEEFMFLGLRCIKGISFQDFEKRFGKNIDSVYGDVINKYEKSGYLIRSGDRLFLSDKGIDVSNTIMAEFLL